MNFSERLLLYILSDKFPFPSLSFPFWHTVVLNLSIKEWIGNYFVQELHINTILFRIKWSIFHFNINNHSQFFPQFNEFFCSDVFGWAQSFCRRSPVAGHSAQYCSNSWVKTNLTKPCFSQSAINSIVERVAPSPRNWKIMQLP